MTDRKLLDLGLLVTAFVFILATVFMAIYSVQLVGTDVSVVAMNPSEYTEYELRVKGVVADVNGLEFGLEDIATPTFELKVTHTGELPSGFGPGAIVYVKGVLTDTQQLTFESTEIEMATQGDSAGWVAPYAQKIFYFHTPAAWVSYLAFGIVLVASVLFLIKGSERWDRIAKSSAEIGVIFCTLAIITGPIWAKPEWGVYWRWEDTKLLTTFVLWLIYLGYVALRVGAHGEHIARIAAVYGIIGFVAVPLSFISSRIWNSLHPNPVGHEGSMSAIAGMTLLIGVIALSLFFIYLLKRRVEIVKLKEEIEDLKDEIEGGME
ncbi:MAG: cytochrome c biogenesis protein CcsA [Methanobacteriota archaeon]|nr:MAG: cytochrome c biogenesis protein CcsA [Euryarchaeota archaeon]